MKFFDKVKSFFGIQNAGGYEATRWTPSRALPFWPTLDPRHEVDTGDRFRLWTSARSLYANSPETRHVVKTCTAITGYLMPIPQSSDPDFNAAAEKAFMKRVNDPHLFEASGRMNWKSVQLWLEERAIIDGDALTVLTKERDGGGSIQLFAAPQVCGDEDGFLGGCLTDKRGRVRRYRIKGFNNEEASTVDARSAILYSHTIDPAAPRGISELATAIPTAKDLADLLSYHKVSAKLAASIAIIEEKPLEDSRPGHAGFLKDKNKNPKLDGVQPEETITINGNRAVSLAPGRKLSILKDERPTSQQREFCRDLVHSIALAMGLDWGVIFDPDSLGSAGTRLSLAKLREWVSNRLIAREQWANRVYQHIIACEVAAERLAPCKTDDWQAVRWIPRSDMTIDVGRVGNLQIALIKEGLADLDNWCLSTQGMTFETLIRRKAKNIAAAKAAAEEFGVELNHLVESVEVAETPPPDEEEEERTSKYNDI